MFYIFPRNNSCGWKHIWLEAVKGYEKNNAENEYEDIDL